MSSAQRQNMAEHRFSGTPRSAPSDSRRAPGGAFRSPHALLGLQSTVGNRAVLRLIQGGVIQRVTVDDYRALMGDTTGTKKRNFSLGNATRAEANKIGADWVGKKLTGKYSQSDDLLHQYRKATDKPNHGEAQANVEARPVPNGSYPINGHISIDEV